MLKKLLFAVAVALLLPLIALAQINAMGAAPSSLAGSYNGQLVGAMGSNAFTVEIAESGDAGGGNIRGKATFYGGLAACRGTMPLEGTVGAGSIMLNVAGRSPGCERVLTLRQQADGKLVGTMPPQDGVRTVPWDIVLTRK